MASAALPVDIIKVDRRSHSTPERLTGFTTLEVLQCAMDVLDDDDSTCSRSPSSYMTHQGTPLLECISVSDDSSSVSSVSSDEMDSPRQTTRRSIFNTFWEVKGGSPCIRRSEADCNISMRSDVVTEQSGDDSVSSGVNSYERSLRARECGPKILQENKRRTIFGSGCYSRSEPLLALAQLTADRDQLGSFQKSHSAPMLPSRPLSSCLRKPRFSGPTRRISDTTTSTSSSVSFNPDVRVVCFERPQENWAASGWSRWFV